MNMGGKFRESQKIKPSLHIYVSDRLLDNGDRMAGT